MSAKILYVDDEPRETRYLQILLQRSEGYQVENALTVEEAMTKLSEMQFDLLIIDLMLPFGEYGADRGAVSGYAGLEIVKSDLCKDIPKIIVSAAAHNPEIHEICEQFGVVAVIGKPIMPKRLCDIIIQTLEDSGSKGPSEYIEATEEISFGPILEDLSDREQFVMRSILHDLRSNLGLTASQLKNIIEILKSRGIDHVGDVTTELPTLSKEAILYTKLLYDFFIGSSIKINTIDLRNPVQEGLELAARFLHDRTEVSRFISSDNTPIRGNSEILAHVIMNLIRNAYEATSEGGMVSIECLKSGSNGLVRIGNTGKSIRYHNRIFDLGYTTKSGDSRGIGLTFCHEVVEKLNGTLEYSRDTDVHGTQFTNVFTVTLPLYMEEAR